MRGRMVISSQVGFWVCCCSLFCWLVESLDVCVCECVNSVSTSIKVSFQAVLDTVWSEARAPGIPLCRARLCEQMALHLRRQQLQ